MVINIFPKGICPEVNVIARLEYELAYYDFAVHRFNHYTSRTLRRFMLLLEKNQFLTLGVLFLDMSRLSRMRFRQFVSWNVHPVFFLHICFQVIAVLLIFAVFVVNAGTGRCN